MSNRINIFQSVLIRGCSKYLYNSALKDGQKAVFFLNKFDRIIPFSHMFHFAITLLEVFLGSIFKTENVGEKSCSRCTTQVIMTQTNKDSNNIHIKEAWMRYGQRPTTFVYFLHVNRDNLHPKTIQLGLNLVMICLNTA